MKRFNQYLSLTKPGIIRGNIITCIAGFLFASNRSVDLGLLISVVIGTSLIIAGACVFNNILDINIDKKMKRTARRVLVEGKVTIKNALILGTALSVAGLTILTLFTNLLTVGVGLAGLFSYVVLYGYYKRRSVHGTLVGTISGSTPPVAGYCAVTGNLDANALILFLMLVSWQMAHFYAIAMFRVNEYKAASIPVMPVVKGQQYTKSLIYLYICAFATTSLFLVFIGSAGYIYGIGLTAVSLAWLWYGRVSLGSLDYKHWAKRMFLTSLMVIMATSLLLSVDPWLL